MYYFKNLTPDSPTIILDSHSKTGLIKGKATCNDQTTYKAVYHDISEYCEKHLIENFSINLEIFNVKMAKALIDLIKVLNKGTKQAPKIHWIYSKKDVEMKQMGRYYSRLLNIEFHFMEN